MQYEFRADMQKRLENSFTYHAPTADQIPRYEHLRAKAHALAMIIVLETPPSREQSTALTKLEEVVMWANKAIACNE